MTTSTSHSVNVKAAEAASRNVRPRWLLYSSILVALLQPFQSGWSTSQLNSARFNDAADCSAQPVAAHTCLMFPGHSQLEWTFATNAWVVGGMAGSLCCGYFSDRWGRKSLLSYNCLFIVVGAAIQASVSSIWAFAVGRLIAGIASGVATGTLGAYVNELSPPHLRNVLGLGMQISITLGIFLPSVAFFFADTSSGWRYLAGFPVVLAALFLLLAPTMMVESPAVLLVNNRREEAKQVIERLYGEEHVDTALAWLEATETELELLHETSSRTREAVLSSKYRLQLAGAVLLACSQQLSGINAVFYYSGNIFRNAGISDPRVGTVIIDFLNLWPAFGTGFLAFCFGNRPMILAGLAGMFIMAVLMTATFLVDAPALAVIFMALYVVFFGATLGPLVWVVTADLFPDAVRATATSIAVGCNWLCNLVVGVAYPYVAAALGDWNFAPFIALLAIFWVLTVHLVPETAGKTSERIQAEFAERRR